MRGPKSSGTPKAPDAASGGRSSHHVARKGGGATTARTTHHLENAAQLAVDEKDSGAPIDSGVKQAVESHLGADLADVRVHSDETAQDANQVLGARAFAHGQDVFLGRGESGGDLGLMAHELTHVVQQGGAAARKVQRMSIEPANSPAEREADAVAAAVTGQPRREPVLVDDPAMAAGGQMGVAEFLATLQGQVTEAASAELGPIWSIPGCPYIERYFAAYRGRSASQVERALRLYVPGALDTASAHAVMAQVVARVRVGVAHWRETGELPQDAAAIAPTGDAQDATEFAQHGPNASRAALSRSVGDLGPGQTLDAGVASRMSSALGADVSAVTIHTGPEAARTVADHDAVALAAGSHVAFGGGEYQPGTVEGDALLAHELAHTVQQKRVTDEDIAGQVAMAGESAAAEIDANNAAAGALTRLYGRFPAALKRLRDNAGPALTSDFALQRCSKDEKAAAKTQAHAPHSDFGSAAPSHPDRPAPLGSPTAKQEWLQNDQGDWVEGAMETERFTDDEQLDAIANGTESAGPGTRGLHVRKIQQALVDLGFMAGDKVTGTMDSSTTAAVSAFQSSAGLPQTGVVDQATWRALHGRFRDFGAYATVATHHAGLDVYDGTRELTDTDRDAIDGVLNPQAQTTIDANTGQVTTRLPTFQNRAHGRTFEQSVHLFLTRTTDRQYQSMAEGQAERRNQPGELFEWSDINNVGRESKREVDSVFGGFTVGPEPQDGTVLFDRYEDQANRIAHADEDGKMEIALWRLQKMMNSGDTFDRVLDSHGAVRERSHEAAIIERVQHQVARAKMEQLLEIHRCWPGSQGDGKIYLQRYRSGTRDGDRQRMWELFQTIIHEYLHSITNPTYSMYANSLDDAQGHVLREGMTDFLTKVVWAHVSVGPELRRRVEGSFHDPANPIAIPSIGTYSETDQAERLVSLVGAHNLYAAYFRGRVDLIGSRASSASGSRSSELPHGHGHDAPGGGHERPVRS